ncbi:MAG: proton-conducting transporter membrane subunit [Vicinamibacteria bacterium]
MSGGPDPAALLPAALALRLGSIALALASARRPAVSRAVALAGSCLASLSTGALAVSVLASGRAVSGNLLLHGASGFALGYGVDGLSAWFLLALSLLAIPIAVYSLGYLAHGALERRSSFVAIGFSVLAGAVELVFTADGVVGFLFAWELMTLATAALVATEHEGGEARRAAFLFLAMSHVATGCLIAGFLILSAATGSLSFAQMLVDAPLDGTRRDVVFVLFLVGFGVKAGVIPLHVWLPEGHPAAPSNVSALMSAVLIKTGIYGLFRVCAFGLGTPAPSWGVLILLLGGVSAMLGVLYALVQHDLKRLLAYHSIENVGIILLGLGAGMMALSAGRGELAAVGLAASLYHVLNHAVFKGLLFLGAGSVVMATGTRQIEELGGLIKRMPWTAILFLVGAMAISGLPLLNGFVSEWLLFQALLYGFQLSPEALVRFLFPVAGALLALTSALAAACFVKAFGITFLALPRGEGAANARESSWLMLAPQAFLALACLALGLFPGLVLDVLLGVTASLPGVQPAPEMVRGAFAIAPGPGHFDHLEPALVAIAALAAAGLAGLLSLAARYRARRAATWGCGGELSARTEYTATAFSKPLMLIFSAIYRPTREVQALGEAHFPREVTYKAQIEPTFERFVYAPLTRGVLALADRMKVIQAGSLHAYLAYVMALVLGLVLLVWLRG